MAIEVRPVRPEEYDEGSDTEECASIVETFLPRIPRLGELGIRPGYAGLYDMSPDARPLMGEVPGVAGLHVLAGFSGMGFKISPAVGLTMSELILDGRSRAVDISDFRPGRFAEGKPIKAQHEYQAD